MPSASATTDELRAVIATYVDEIGGPVSALRALQHQRGWIDTGVIDAVADVFNLSRAEVRGLVEFYSDFKTMPPADHVLAVCQAEACQAAGSRQLTRTLEDRLGVGLGRMTPDRSIELEAIYCLGLCARAPAMMVDGELVVEADTVLDHLLDETRP